MATRSIAERAAVLPPSVAPLLNQQQLAAHYGVSDWQIRRWMEAGLPTEPMPEDSRLIRYDLAEVKKWMADRAEPDAA